MREDLKEVLFSEEVLSEKVRELAVQISKDYKGKELVVVGILKGSVVFTAELIKNIDIYCELDFMAVSSYGNSTETTGVVRILKDLDNSIEGKHILIVEDIVDTGTTLSYLLKYLKARKAASIEIVALLNKPARRKVELPVKYIGFEVPDAFIVGYGIDYAEKYRNLPCIGILKPEIYEK
ncbi:MULTISPECIES: hypoxanthine phosphoribosyltransferase [Clostridium]|uniref:Hypoxanthine phosphoribosyltransferase n=3 Tax=root TaxID=1 RepID=C4IMN3_CLOBU|nr:MULTISPECIES: hypoxanthine phosphoribosyltransferase [Clostridium]ALP91789.1 hypoxanthine phosphoribosyltransferase [Clostridium butyricum]ALS18495.1 hypoxanthine phosphoribosyltransferase [Clostridium butyricum]ANF15630.1 hypoxanthine phosphoribosyltransferase [Clostridium butyricum]AOR95570.1 hypoxanthine phosphoribosyltransferase [Clostridium butyricum]APF23471.1 hypoxanthine phosphoribosyltransferase [Clostridium butyricum]